MSLAMQSFDLRGVACSFLLDWTNEMTGVALDGLICIHRGSNKAMLRNIRCSNSTKKNRYYKAYCTHVLRFDSIFEAFKKGLWCLLAYGCYVILYGSICYMSFSSLILCSCLVCLSQICLHFPLPPLFYNMYNVHARTVPTNDNNNMQRKTEMCSLGLVCNISFDDILFTLHSYF